MFEGEKGPAQDMPGGRYTQNDSPGGSTAAVRMPIGGVLDGVHIGAIWRIRFYRACAVAMRPYVTLL